MKGNIYYMKSNASPLGNWIRTGLKEIGQNQEWLAEKVGVRPPQISRIISGNSDASPDLLSAIADALGKPREQIFRVSGYLEKVPQHDEWVEEMSHKITLIPVPLRGVAKKFIDSMVEGEQLNRSKTRRNNKPAHKGVGE